MLRLTAEEKVLLALLPFVNRRDDVEAPADATQDGLSSGLDLRRSHVSIALSGLRKKALVEERLSHVKGSARRRNVYFLTEAGARRSEELRKRIEDEEVLIRDGAREERSRLGELLKRIRGKASLVEVLPYLREGTFDLELFESRTENKDVDFSDSLPKADHFFGRAEELARLREFLQSKGLRIFALSGIAGMGKTALLSRFVSEQDTHKVFTYRVCEWSTLRSLLKRLSEFLGLRGKRALHTFLKFQGRPDMEEAVGIVLKDLEGFDALLVFEDAHNAGEEVVMFFKALAEGIRSTKGSKLIVSGRSIPSFYSRMDVRLGACVEEMRLRGLSEHSALEVFRRQREGGDADFPEVFRLTKGHPLLIELIALGGVGSGRADAKRYIQEEICSRLTDEERAIMGMASVFRYPVKAEALVAGGGSSFDALDALVHKSLVVQSGTAYELHDILREFFYERLTPSSRNGYHLAAARYYEGEIGPLARVESVHNLLKAGEPEGACRKLVEDGMGLITRGYQEEVLELIDRFSPSSVEGGQWVSLQFLKGEILTMLGDWKGASECYRRSLDASREAGNDEGVAQAHYELGVMHYRRGEWDAALERYEKALALSKKGGYGEREAKLYNTMGIVRWRKGDMSSAADCYKRSIAICKKLGDMRGMAGAYNNLGIVHWELRQMDRALGFYGKALAISKKMDDRRIVAILYNNMGEVHRVNGDAEEARAFYGKSLDLSKELGFKWQIAEVYRNLGQISKGRERREHLERALELFENLGAKRDVADVRKMLKK